MASFSTPFFSSLKRFLRVWPRPIEDSTVPFTLNDDNNWNFFFLLAAAAAAADLPASILALARREEDKFLSELISYNSYLFDIAFTYSSHLYKFLADKSIVQPSQGCVIEN